MKITPLAGPAARRKRSKPLPKPVPRVEADSSGRRTRLQIMGGWTAGLAVLGSGALICRGIVDESLGVVLAGVCMLALGGALSAACFQAAREAEFPGPVANPNHGHPNSPQGLP